jgi:CheY-like chemotaxis protein
MAGEQLWFGVAFDLGERADDTASRGHAAARSARGDAMQAAELKDRFLASVSHELRAPIAALLLWERLLRDGELSPDEKVRALDAIHNSAMAQSRLVDDLIDVARISTGKLEVRLEPIWIEKILDDALQEVTPAVAAKQHELVVDVATDLGSVDGDAVRLVQVLVNLLTNAVNFTPAHGRVALSARREAAELVIEVADNGCGIEREYLPRVFDLFSQFDGGSTREQRGLGLGLAIARELVELHGGTIAAFSEGIGTGARFAIRLPAGRARVATPIPEVPSIRPLDGITVLVVDDDARVLEALELLLTRAGANVTGTRSVDDAWSALERSTYDVVVSDLAMPLADGYQLVQRMRSDPALARVPAIALTAHATSGDIERARTEGFDLHLAKPVRLDQLVAGISTLARR